MLYREHRPAFPLSSFVQQLWYCAGCAPSHERELVLPDGSMSLVIALHHGSIPVYQGLDAGSERRGAASLVAGARSGAMLIHTETLAGMLGVHFHPGGARPFFGAPAGLFVEQDLGLEDVLGRFGATLRERLLEAATPERMFQAMETWLLEAAGPRLQLDQGVAAVLRELDKVPAERPVEEIGRMSGMSHRRFIETFRDAVGLSPKRYARVRRFREALRRANAGKRLAWSELAAECGYFDQSHLVREFREFAGIAPGAYAALRGDWEAHLRLPG